MCLYSNYRRFCVVYSAAKKKKDPANYGQRYVYCQTTMHVTKSDETRTNSFINWAVEFIYHSKFLLSAKY